MSADKTTDGTVKRIVGPPPGEELTEGGLPIDRTPDPWESYIQGTCELLSGCGTLDNLERRHAEDRLGETVYSGFPVYARSALVVTESLLDLGIITSEELQSRMTAVRSRLEDA